MDFNIAVYSASSNFTPEYTLMTRVLNILCLWYDILIYSYSGTNYLFRLLVSQSHIYKVVFNYQDWKVTPNPNRVQIQDRIVTPPTSPPPTLFPNPSPFPRILRFPPSFSVSCIKQALLKGTVRAYCMTHHVGIIGKLGHLLELLKSFIINFGKPNHIFGKPGQNFWKLGCIFRKLGHIFWKPGRTFKKLSHSFGRRAMTLFLNFW